MQLFQNLNIIDTVYILYNDDVAVYRVTERERERGTHQALILYTYHLQQLGPAPQHGLSLFLPLGSTAYCSTINPLSSLLALQTLQQGNTNGSFVGSNRQPKFADLN